MERLDVFDCSNVLIASYFTDDRGCAHENREHTLIYLCSGELEIEERGKKTVLHPGDCAFMRRDNRMWLQKKVEDGKPYRSVVLKFSRPFLREFYQTLNRQQIQYVFGRFFACIEIGYDRFEQRTDIKPVTGQHAQAFRPLPFSATTSGYRAA